MDTAMTISDDELYASIQESSSVVANAIDLFEADLCSFLIQMKDESLTKINSRYALHSIKSKPNALDDIYNTLEKTWILLNRNNKPGQARLSWMRCILFFQEIFMMLSKREVKSDKEHYINEAQHILTILEYLSELNYFYKRNIKNTFLPSNEEKITDSLKDLKENYIRITNDIYNMDLINEEISD